LGGKGVRLIDTKTPEFLKFVGPVGPKGQKIMRSANNVGPHVRQTFFNDVFTFLTEVGNEGRYIGIVYIANEGRYIGIVYIANEGRYIDLVYIANEGRYIGISLAI
jgi:hypothetical protein